MRSVALVLGGADCWRDDLNAALDIIPGIPDYYAVNDQIEHFPGEIIACTLHPERIAEWVDKRAEKMLPAPIECWTRTQSKSEQQLNVRLTTVTPDRPSLVKVHFLKEWGGTSGLFAFQVARARGHDRIIFCGVPMDEMGNAFHDIGCAIAKYTRHRDDWKRNMPAIKPFARSMSGWTSEQLGRPDEQWLGEANVTTLTNAL